MRPAPGTRATAGKSEALEALEARLAFRVDLAAVVAGPLLGIVQQNMNDQNWISPATPATGFVFAAFVFFIFCFAMSRYSMWMEQRLHTGHKR